MISAIHRCKLKYVYSDQAIIGFIHISGNTSTSYIYQRNAINDIIGIYNNSGNIVARYIYDAYGNHTVCNPDGSLNTSSSFIGNINPIRYKGYYYDQETGLYALPQRYYDSEVGRFLNADSIDNMMLQMNELNGLNLYAFCLNNPVNYSDPTGGFVLSLTALILMGFGVGTAIGAGASIVSQGIDKGWDNINLWQVGLDGLLGGIGGALAMTPLNMWAIAGISAGLGAAGSLDGHFLNGGNFSNINWWDVGISTAIGFAGGLIGGHGATHFKTLNAAPKSAAFLKAAASYDKVLTKIAAGGYKNLAGAAGARSLTGRALITAWNQMVVSQAGKALTMSLIKTGGSLFALNIGKSYLYNAIGW